MTGSQFDPITKPYLRMWQERLEGDMLAKSIKAVSKKRRKAKKRAKK